MSRNSGDVSTVAVPGSNPGRPAYIGQVWRHHKQDGWLVYVDKERAIWYARSGSPNTRALSYTITWDPYRRHHNFPRQTGAIAARAIFNRVEKLRIIQALSQS